MTFQKASRKRVKLKLAITGPSGSGKTYSALRLATGLGGKIALIDTENASASLYADKFAFDTVDVKPPFDGQQFIDNIALAVAGGYDVVIVDSASHFWQGILDWKSHLDERPGANSYTNWNQAGKKYQNILDALLQSPIHVICCMRSKMAYELQENERGKKVPVKIGLAPIIREGGEYDFGTVFDIQMDHCAKTSKDRSGLFTDQVFQVTEETGKALRKWVDTGAPPAVANPPTIAGSNPDIAKPKNSDWSQDQLTEAGSIRAELERLPGGTEAFSKLWAGMKHDPPSSVIDAISDKLRELRELEDNSKNTEVQ